MRVIREYTTVNKASWGAGPWQEEPDKVQGVDEATGLDVLLVRGPSGAWCGYVGVPASHPFFGKGYDECAQRAPCEDLWCDHSPSARVHVHGGLTFADSCQEPTPEGWEDWRRNVTRRREEAVRYPRGDMAELLRERGHLLDDYAAWVEHRTASGICHVGHLGAAERVWWLGFDCAHSGDLCPKYHGTLGISMGDEEYRTQAYVAHEVAGLARQLADLLAVARS